MPIPALSRRAGLAACALALAPAAAGAAPVPAPTPSGDAAILLDARTGEVLYERAPAKRRAIASATKLMTALLALERARLSERFAAPEYHALSVESKINLREGEKMRVDDLLEALLLESANDAAVTLAEGISGSRRAFVADMNERARSLGLTGTRYANPIGLDDEANYSTARDLAALTRKLLENEAFRRIVDKPAATLESGARRRVVGNRNLLVRRHPFVDGVKTGHTRTAGYVLIGSASGRGERVVSVVLGEPSQTARDADSLELLRYGLDQFRRLPVLKPGSVLARARVAHRDERVGLAPAAGFALTVRRGERPQVRVHAPGELDGPLEKGSRAGSVQVLHRGKVVHTAPLVTTAKAEGAGPLRRAVSALGPAFATLLVAGLVLAVTLVVLRTRARRRRRARTA